VKSHGSGTLVRLGIDRDGIGGVHAPRTVANR
jgi:hypothetical protein